MRSGFVLLAVGVSLFHSARAQSPEAYRGFVSAAAAAYNAGQHAASDSLYALAFDAGPASPTDLYNAACSAALAGRIDRAFELLDRAAAAGWENTAHARIDPDLAALRADATRWAAFEASIDRSMQDRYGDRFNPALRAELAEIRAADQAGRAEMALVYERYEGAARDSAMAVLWRRQSAVDSLNLVQLDRIVAEYGWPGNSLVGRDGALAAFLVLQHADLDVQERYLPLLEAAVAAGEASAGHLAYLVDRIRVRNNLPQRYGSQVRQHPATGGLEFFPIEDEAGVDERRAGVGLGPLAEYARQMGFEYVGPSSGE